VSTDLDAANCSRLVVVDGSHQRRGRVCSEIHDGAVVERGGDRCRGALDFFFSTESVSSTFVYLHHRLELGDRFVKETIEGLGGVVEDDESLRGRELRAGARAERVLVEAQAAERADSGSGENRFDEILGWRDDVVDLPSNAAVDEAIVFADLAGEDDGRRVFTGSFLSTESGVILRGFAAAGALDSSGR